MSSKPKHLLILDFMAHLNGFDPTIDHHRDDPEHFLPEPIWSSVLLKLSTSVVAAGRCLDRMIQATHLTDDASPAPLPSTAVRQLPHDRPLATPHNDRCLYFTVIYTASNSAACTAYNASRPPAMPSFPMQRPPASSTLARSASE
ncbi:hypothetical protein ACLOJK_028213 [Asimina triloba]